MKKLFKFLIIFLKIFFLLILFSLLYKCTTDRNSPPNIEQIIIQNQNLYVGSGTQLNVIATDKDGDKLIYNWSASAGRIPLTGNPVYYWAPDLKSSIDITCIVSDGKDITSKIIKLDVYQKPDVFDRLLPDN